MHIVVVGYHSQIGCALSKEYAACANNKVAIINGKGYDGSPLMNNTNTVQNFEYANFEMKEFPAMASFLDGKVDLFLYFSGCNLEKTLTDGPIVNDLKMMMRYNFIEPVICVSYFLPLVKHSKGIISFFAEPQAGPGAANTSLYSASKKALTAYLDNIGKQNPEINVIPIYPGFQESMKLTGEKIEISSSPVDDMTVDTIRNCLRNETPHITLKERNAMFCQEPELTPCPPPFHIQSANSLCKAIARASEAEVRDILRQFKMNPDMLLEEDKDGRNSFHYAANSGKVSIMEMVLGKLKKKTLINSTDSLKWTPLHFAAHFGHLRLTKFLLQKNGDPNCLAKGGMGAMHLLIKNEPKDLNNDLKTRPLYLNVLKNLIEIGADVNQRNFDWFTPVHQACYSGSINALEFFLQNEGDPHRKTRFNHRTPLAYAVKKEHTACVKMLLEQGKVDPIDCFDFASLDMKPLLEKYREKNCRLGTDNDDQKKEIIVIRNMDDFPRSAKKCIDSSNLLENRQLIDENWETFLYVLRFLTRKIYKTPEQFAENPQPDPPREICSRTSHGMTLDQAMEKLVTNGNPQKMFKVIEEAGRGGFGSVLKVKRLSDKLEVAIKKVPHVTEKQQWNNLDEIHFLQECRHSCVVQYSKSYINRDEIWMVMEFMEGGSLKDAVGLAKNYFPEKQIAYVTKEILRGLRLMHSKNFAHRDLKSANIMLTVSGDVKIIDFGLCVEMGSVETKNMVGSPFWIPPEMVRRESHGIPSDIWSLGILCLEMANVSPPNRDSALRAMFNCAVGITPEFTTPNGISEGFADFLSCMLKCNPDERSTANELLQHEWLQVADTRKGMCTLIHHLFIEKSLEKSLGIL